MPPARLGLAAARRIWLAAQRLGSAPFGAGPDAVRRAVEHLGYVQIDTIHVVERSHHHILWSRIPDYRRADLTAAQSVDKSVFEYWTHALAYVPTRDYRFFLPEMRRRAAASPVPASEVRRVVGRVRRDGALTIRDITDDELVEKDHLWASRKPSKRALQAGFYAGTLAIAGRDGMVKRYELATRHFGWTRPPRPATPRQVSEYLVDRALAAQGLIGVASAAHLGSATMRKGVAAAIEARVRRGRLRPVAVPELGGAALWAAPATLDARLPEPDDTAAHILSPFDPLVIQRPRLEAFFGYAHRFEAYLPAARRQFGYFALPVLVGERIVAALDLKADRAGGRLEIRQWTWTEAGSPTLRPVVEEALGRFERFQFGD